MEPKLRGKSSGRRSSLLYGLALAAGGVWLAGASPSAFAEEGWIKLPQVKIRSDPSPAGGVVGSAPCGAKLSILEHGGQRNAWCKVSFHDDAKNQDGQGWVYKGDLSDKKVDPIKGDVGSDASASQTTLGAAGKGFNDDAIKYTDAKHVSRAPVQKMRDDTAAISADDLSHFMSDGKVGGS